MRETVKTIAANLVLLRKLVGDRVERRILGNSIVKRSIEGRNHRHGAAKNFPRRANAAYGARIVQWRDVAKPVEIGDDVIVDQSRTGKSIAAVDDSMANSIDRFELRDRVEPVDDKLYSLVMTRDCSARFPKVIPVGVKLIRARSADSVDDAARQFALSAAIGSFNHLKLERRTTAVKNKDFHHWPFLALSSLLRRASTPHEAAIQVGTPKRGSTQRMSTM